MHGRLKVRTTAEQAEAKRVERAKKLALFTAAKEKIFTKRQNGELDEEALQLTEKVLGANPDFYTLWNFRKEIFIKLKEELTQENTKALCVKELSFLQQCLQVNPKSYGVWHHRCWIMTFMPDPDWKNELELCTLYLKYDERNFHCWDYRRFVVAQSKVLPKDEFEFTTSKINENFSNYSSWHYRSKLLPLVYPSPLSGGVSILEEQLMKEFDLAQNACFTDPYDSSAWFYHRWLLGRATPDLAITCLHVCITDKRMNVMVRFSKPVQLSDLLASKVVLGEESLQGNWTNAAKDDRAMPVWIFESCLDNKLPHEAHKLLFHLNESMKQHVEIPPGSVESWVIPSSQGNFLFRTELTAVHTSVLETELESCQLLLEEEPESKWTMLTMVLLMRAIDPVKHEEETIKILNKLSEVDGSRKGYYQDMRRKFLVENAIEKHCCKYPGFMNEESRKMDLSNMDLHSLVHVEQLLLMQSIDLSKNSFSSLDSLSGLQCLKHLNVDNNNLKSLLSHSKLLHLPWLETLSIRNNSLTDVDSLSCLSQCTNLTRINVSGNPFSESSKHKEQIKKLCPSLQYVDEMEV